MSKNNQKEDKLLNNIFEKVHDSFIADRTILSFNEYFDMLFTKPERHLRCSAQYIVDMFKHFGQQVLKLPTGRVTRYNLFDAPFTDGDGRVAGHERVQEQLFRILCNFAREGKINKLILLHGPNGSAKSSIVRCIMAGMEAYSRLPEGALYSFNWIFPTERLAATDRIGFGNEQKAHLSNNTYAHLSNSDMDARIPCDLHDHPLFLLPQSQRLNLLSHLLPNQAENIDGSENSQHLANEYLRLGDLCYKCRRIYDALLSSYDGDVAKVLKHIQIERFYVSRRYRRAAATIEPQLSVDAHIQQVTADHSLASLPKALQHTSLFTPTGPLVDANRGVLEYSDLLKRPVDAFKYLLSTIETSTVSMDSFLIHLDIVFLASTNETYLDAFKEHPDFPSFKARIELVKVPYLLRYSNEVDIYKNQITSRIVGRHIAPHTISVASLWAVLSRMRRADKSLYPSDLVDVIDSLTPIEKLRLYDNGKTPSRLTTRQAKELRHHIADIFKESYSYPKYEGRYGASAREIRSILLNAAYHEGYQCLNPLAVFANINELLQAKSVYEFLRQDAINGYHDHVAFLRETEKIYTSWIDDEVRESTGIATEQSYHDLFSRYVSHVSHWVKHEKMNDPISGELRDPDENFMSEIEKVLMASGEASDDFRRAVIGTIGARSLEFPDKKPNYTEIFGSYIENLREDFYTKKHKVLKKMYENFLKYTESDIADLSAKEIEQSAVMLNTLRDRYGYCQNCARDTVAFLVRRQHGEHGDER
ncbi:MAG: serine protein kinase PrkA [Deltaproteobacteria bacterium]|nr:serine protein kinase PrkA [Deltaproteobacteria bacterium]